jgi:NADH:ubiquinone oxidoreductase subunit F (NADH-binding)
MWYASEKVIGEVKTSGLCERADPDHPPAEMEALLKRPPGTQKYLIRNADKCNLGAFMDRSILVGRPTTLSSREC